MIKAIDCIEWLRRVFGHNAGNDVEERLLRFGEETLELMQSRGITEHQAEALVKQVFAKPPGDPFQELGGVMVTLSSYCAVDHMDADKALSIEWHRCNIPEVIAKIQAKHAEKAVVSSSFKR